MITIMLKKAPAIMDMCACRMTCQYTRRLLALATPGLLWNETLD